MVADELYNQVTALETLVTWLPAFPKCNAKGG